MIFSFRMASYFPKTLFWALYTARSNLRIRLAGNRAAANVNTGLLWPGLCGGMYEYFSSLCVRNARNKGSMAFQAFLWKCLVRSLWHETWLIIAFFQKLLEARTFVVAASWKNVILPNETSVHDSVAMFSTSEKSVVHFKLWIRTYISMKYAHFRWKSANVAFWPKFADFFERVVFHRLEKQNWQTRTFFNSPQLALSDYEKIIDRRRV